MRFALNVQPAARKDIQESIRWYNRQQKGLGRRFHAEVREKFEFLRVNPFFQNRYETVRCLPLKKFPFMVHYSVLEEKQLVIVHAVFHTSLDPENWERDK